MMKSYGNVTMLALSVLLLLLMGCSNDSQDQDDQLDEYAENQDGYDQGETDYLSEYPEGWRSGTLLMVLTIAQSGDAVEESSAQGGTKSTIKWDFALSAKQTFPVMVPSDFTRTLPDYEADLLDPLEFREDLYIPVSDVEPITEGQVSHNGRLEVLTPRANDTVLLVQETVARGDLSEFRLDSILPSVVGRGFDTNIEFAYRMEGSVRIMSKSLTGHVLEDETACCEYEFRRHQFFPEPDMEIAKRIVSPVNEGVPAEINEQNRQMELDFVSLLENISTNTELRSVMHPGMRWVAEPNQLKLRYHSESQKLLTEGGMYGLAAPAEQPRYTLEITLTAD